jgi:predicted ATP-grasp superfamily ATP-dependent carboligase
LNLLIIGASARAAAWSAYLSGMCPACVDLFADADLQRQCPVHSMPQSDYPRAFLEASRHAPPGPWLYTGALENHPSLIEAIARERPLWGNPSAVLRTVRCPRALAERLPQFPMTTETKPTDRTKEWLVKPRHSAGGGGIRRWHGEKVGPGYYWQECIEGTPCSAMFVGQNDGAATFLGATRQLIGVPWLHARGFQYCGNIGPLQLPAKTYERLAHLGNMLAIDFGMRGLFGVDFIMQDDIPWPLEVNPRITAGMEVLERAAGQSFFSYHREAFAAGPSPIMAVTRAGQVHGKAIYYAREHVVFPEEGPWDASLQMVWSPRDYPDYADIPHAGSRIEKGQPILTLFASAASADACAESLHIKAQALDRRLFG